MEQCFKALRSANTQWIQDLMSPSRIHCVLALLSALKHCFSAALVRGGQGSVLQSTEKRQHAVDSGLDVALQNPLRVGASQCFEALFHRIGAGPLLTKPIGVFISSGFYNGGECEQIQCLLRSILHRGNSEWAHRFAVRLRDVNTS